jgi:hypothetical protein
LPWTSLNYETTIKKSSKKERKKKRTTNDALTKNQTKRV